MWRQVTSAARLHFSELVERGDSAIRHPHTALFGGPLQGCQQSHHTIGVLARYHVSYVRQRRERCQCASAEVEAVDLQIGGPSLCCELANKSAQNRALARARRTHDQESSILHHVDDVP